MINTVFNLATLSHDGNASALGADNFSNKDGFAVDVTSLSKC